MKNSRIFADTLICAEISASTLQVIGGLLKWLFVGSGPEDVVPLDTPEAKELACIADNFGQMTMQTIRDHGLDPHSEDLETPITFEVPLYVILAVERVTNHMNKCEEATTSPWVEEVTNAWAPFTQKAAEVAYQWDRDRDAFEQSWE